MPTQATFRIHQSKVLSVRKSRSLQLPVPGHSSAFQASPTNLCLVRQVPAQLHPLCCHVLQAGFPEDLLFLNLALNPKLHGISLLQNLLTHQISWPNPLTSWLSSSLLPLTTEPPGQQVALLHPFKLHGCYLPLSQSAFIFKCWPGASYMIHIRPLLQCATFACSSISFTFFWLPSLVRARVPHDAGATGSCLSHRCCISSPGYITSHYMVSKTLYWGQQYSYQLVINFPQLPIVMKSILTTTSSPSPTPQPRAVGYIFEASHCAPHFNSSLNVKIRLSLKAKQHNLYY